MLEVTHNQEQAAAFARVALLEAELAEARATIASLQRAYRNALEQLQLLRHRLYVAKAERVDVSAEQLAFDTMFEEVKRLEKELGDESEEPEAEPGPQKQRKPGGKGRRNLAESELPVVSVEVPDPELEGVAERIGTEETYRLGYERGGMRRIVISRFVYKVETEKPPATAVDKIEEPSVTPVGDDETAGEQRGDQAGARFVTAPLPKELFRRCMLAPALIAHILVGKYLLGVPFYRLEQQFALQGATLDRGTMCRYAEDTGATLGVIVEAARKEAFDTAFCLSTDATGVCIQPGPIKDRKVPQRGPCRKGHFFVVLADCDHIFFEYQPKHTSAAVCEMFKGFSGYIQADAHAIYDALFRGDPPKGVAGEQNRVPPTEVGCWSHARRNFWEAAVCKHPLGLEGLRRINIIFAADRTLSALPPSQRKVRRDELVRPLIEAFFKWVHIERQRPRERGLVTSALGYAANQEQPLCRFLDDGRLRMENNSSERALRAIATARKSWLFFGSDDHASAAANLFSLIASCKLHSLDPEAYLTEVIRVMPYWPRERYLELAPKYWANTRALLIPAEMKKPLGHVTVPPALHSTQKHPPD